MMVAGIIAGTVTVLITIYLLMIMPGMKKKPDTDVLKQYLYAHRGLFDNQREAPENSLKAFQRAVDMGFGIELDVQLSKDGEAVVFHDDTLERMCKQTGKVCDYTYEELSGFFLLDSSEKIPLFRDVLKEVDGKVPLIIEYKMSSPDSQVCRVGDAILKDYKGLYCIESFNPFCVYWYKKHRKNIVRGQLSDDFFKNGSSKGIEFFIVAKLLTNFLTRPDFIAYDVKNYRNLSRRICRNLYKNTAVAWTIKSQEQLADMRKQYDMFIFDSFVPKSEGKLNDNLIIQ